MNLLAGTGSGAAALALARDFLARHPRERHVLAALGFALRDSGEAGEADALADLERLVEVHDGDPALAARLAAIVRADPSRVASPASKATRGGEQTGELDLDAAPALAQLAALVAAAVRARAAQPVHPGLGPAPAAWSLRAWGTVLSAGGRQLPHIHPTGWLSGVYYLEVPVMRGEGRSPGWLELGAPPERFLVAVPPRLRAVEPRAGRLVTFPSYFHHRTLPFAGDGQRISIAFDVVPRR